MSRKLVALNLALLAATAYAAAQLRELYLAKQAREAAARNRKVAPAPVPPMTPLAPSPVAVPANFAPIATHMLFDKSRDSKVVIEPPPPPPPPPPVPPFPVLRGIMRLPGEGLISVFSIKASDPPIEVKPGDRIGHFTLVSVNEQEAVFAWNGNQYRKSVEEIRDRSKEQSGETSRPAAPAPGAAPAPVVKRPLGPDKPTGEGTRACNPSDSNPAGAVVDGFRKVEFSTPFGKACRWEAVGR
jgi:hypothetical protein